MARLPIPFGNPATYPGHSGVDYPQPRGTFFRASGPGKVTLRNSNSRAGNMVWVEYDAMPSQNGVAYAHLDDYRDSPPVGTRVVEGTILGRVGNSGNSTGPHLHSEVNGYATTDGYWKWFDPNRVVGGGQPSGPTAGNQRQVGANGANGRNDPSTSGPVTQTLPPGTVGDFNAWIRGEAVQGNNVWFRGAHSGDFFWSGGFTDTGTHDLQDLNPPPTATNQRVVGPNGANGRNVPSTSGPITQTLAPGTVGDFNGWTNGQSVEGNNIWFRGLHSGDWFWSGGFTSKDTAGLDFVDLNPPAPGAERTVGVNPANVRALPYTSSPTVKSEAAATVIRMNAYARAESVQGQDIWFRRDSDNNWMWAGGFTVQAVDGLPEIAAPEPPKPVDPDNPRGLPEYPPVYARAKKGLEAPLGYHANGEPALRDMAGSMPVEPIIDTFIIHHTATTVDQLDWFSYKNNRDVCPTFYLRTDGSVFELIRPQWKPATTGPQWNYHSIAVETLDATPGPAWEVTDLQLEEIAQMIAWLREFDGKLLNGVPVDFKIDREHVITHKEALPGTTECPGPYLQGNVDAIIERALSIYAENHPPIPTDDYVVPKALGDQIRTLILRAFPPTDP